MAKFTIPIEDFNGGLAPRYFEDDYPTFGNLNMAGKARAIDLSSPHSMREGLGMADVTNGTVAREIKVFQDVQTQHDVFGIAFNEDDIYIEKFTESGGTITRENNESVTTDTDFPKKLTPSATDNILSVEDMVIARETNNTAFFAYKIDANQIYRIGRVAVAGTAFTASDNAITNPTSDAHKMRLLVAEDHIFYGRGHLIGHYDISSDTYTDEVLTLPGPFMERVKDMLFKDQTVYVFAGYPDTTLDSSTTTYQEKTKLYLWRNPLDADTWEQEIRFNADIIHARVFKGVVVCFYKDENNSFIGELHGGQLTPIETFDGDPPEHYQVTERNGFLVWVNGTKDVFAYGSPHPQTPNRLFKLAYAGADDNFTTLSLPFGLLVASKNDGSGYHLQQESGFSTDGFWKSILYQINGNDRTGMIDEIRVEYDKLAANEAFDLKLVNSAGTEKYSVTINTQDSTQFHAFTKFESNDIRAEIHFDSNGASTTPKVRSILLKGHTVA